MTLCKIDTTLPCPKFLYDEQRAFRRRHAPNNLGSRCSELAPLWAIQQRGELVKFFTSDTPPPCSNSYYTLPFLLFLPLLDDSGNNSGFMDEERLPIRG
jgi:hypothetical protein